MHPLKEKHKAEHCCFGSSRIFLVPNMSNFKRAGHLVARLLHILKQLRVPLKGTGGNIDSPKRGGKALMSVGNDSEGTAQWNVKLNNLFTIR